MTCKATQLPAAAVTLFFSLLFTSSSSSGPSERALWQMIYCGVCVCVCVSFFLFPPPQMMIGSSSLLNLWAWFTDADSPIIIQSKSHPWESLPLLRSEACLLFCAVKWPACLWRRGGKAMALRRCVAISRSASRRWFCTGGGRSGSTTTTSSSSSAGTAPPTAAAKDQAFAQGDQIAQSFMLPWERAAFDRTQRPLSNFEKVRRIRWGDSREVLNALIDYRKVDSGRPTLFVDGRIALSTSWASLSCGRCCFQICI